MLNLLFLTLTAIAGPSNAAETSEILPIYASYADGGGGGITKLYTGKSHSFEFQKIGEGAVIVGVGPDLSSCRWTFGDGSRTYCGRSATHTFIKPGQYTVSADCTERSGEGDIERHYSGLFQVENGLDPQYPIEFTDKATGKKYKNGDIVVMPADKLGFEFLFTTKAGAENSVKSIQWSFGDENYPATATAAVRFDRAGVFPVSLTARMIDKSLQHGRATIVIPGFTNCGESKTSLAQACLQIPVGHPNIVSAPSDEETYLKKAIHWQLEIYPYLAWMKDFSVKDKAGWIEIIEDNFDPRSWRRIDISDLAYIDDGRIFISRKVFSKKKMDPTKRFRVSLNFTKAIGGRKLQNMISPWLQVGMGRVELKSVKQSETLIEISNPRSGYSRKIQAWGSRTISDLPMTEGLIIKTTGKLKDNGAEVVRIFHPRLREDWTEKLNLDLSQEEIAKAEREPLPPPPEVEPDILIFQNDDYYAEYFPDIGDLKEMKWMAVTGDALTAVVPDFSLDADANKPIEVGEFHAHVSSNSPEGTLFLIGGLDVEAGPIPNFQNLTGSYVEGASKEFEFGGTKFELEVTGKEVEKENSDGGKSRAIENYSINLRFGGEVISLLSGISIDSGGSHWEAQWAGDLNRDGLPDFYATFDPWEKGADPTVYISDRKKKKYWSFSLPGKGC